MELAINNKDIRNKALIISSGLYALFLASLIFFKIIYEVPEEEIAMGVDLNYGIDLTGYGDLQTTNKASTSPNNYDVKPADNSTSNKAVTTPQPAVPQPSTPTRSTKTSTQKTPPVITSEAEPTPVTMKKTPTTSTSTKTSSTAPVSTAPPKPARSVDQGSVMKKSGSGSNSNGTTGTRDGIGGNNNGDGAPGAVGDQGDPRGTPDGKSLYGNPGSGGSSSVSGLSGWGKKQLSLPKDASSEIGFIVLDVVVDDRGDVISCQVIRKSVSPSVADFYRNYIQKNFRSFLIAKGKPPKTDSGRITINLTN